MTCSSDNKFCLRDILKKLQRISTQLCKFTLSKDVRQITINQQKIDHLEQLADVYCQIVVSLSLKCNQSELPVEEESEIFSIVQFIPAFVERIWNILGDEQVAKMRLRDMHAFDQIAVIRTKMTQASMHLIRSFYFSARISNERRFKIIFDNIDNKEFIIRLDDDLNVERELSKFLAKQICDEHKMLLVVKAIEDSYEQKRRTILQSLSRQRILKFIGYPKDNHIANKIQELSEIMPDLSKQQLHLCIRHYGYDFERTLNALFETEQLPFNLRILLRKRGDTFEDIEEGGRKMKLFTDDKIVSDRITPASMEDNVEKVDELVNLLEIDEASIELDGRTLIRKTAADRELDVNNAQERSALIKSSLKFANELEENDEDDDENIEDQATRQALQEERDKKLAEEVGRSGRFNRLNLAAAADDTVYDDEYDDTYEHAQLYTEVDLSANSIDEKEQPPEVGVGSMSSKNPVANVSGNEKKFSPQDRNSPVGGSHRRVQGGPHKGGHVWCKNTAELTDGLKGNAKKQGGSKTTQSRPAVDRRAKEKSGKKNTKIIKEKFSDDL